MTGKKSGGGIGAKWLRRGYKPRRGSTSSVKYQPYTVFVAMPFTNGRRNTSAYEAINKVCSEFRFSCLRVDQKPDSGPINIQIIDGIENSEFLIFDLTNERPNVYYELGYAHGIGNRPEDIILIARKDARLHFDILQLRVLFYDSPSDLSRKLRMRLKSLVAFHQGKGTL